MIFSILFIVYSRNTGNSFWIYWAPFFLAGGALLLGIPVYKRQRRTMTRPEPVPAVPVTSTPATMGGRDGRDPAAGGRDGRAGVRPAAVAAGGKLTIRQAAFIGVGAMVGAGIFSLLGAAGEVAGAAVWISFLIAGAIAILNGYSFAKFGARFPSAGGLLEYVARGFGDGHITGVVAWLVLATNAIVTGMVAVSFGSYASDAVAVGQLGLGQDLRRPHRGRHDDAEHRRLAGRRPGADRRSSSSSSASWPSSPSSTLVNIDPHLLAFSGYPSVTRHRVERRAHVLRVPGLRHRQLHGQGSRRTRRMSFPAPCTWRSASRP